MLAADTQELPMNLPMKNHLSRLFLATTFLSVSVSLAAIAKVPASASSTRDDVFEHSIDELQAAQASGKIDSRRLVQAYLARIAAYDQAGPGLNAVLRLNPAALAQADALDRERRTKGPRGPLHGIPVLIKDNFDTADMPTSGGALALATLQPAADAYQVRRLREAGAVILGKTAMHELAAGITTVSSLTGATRNPYDTTRVPGGSSGGTAAAVAASFAAAGMGSDTCGSIRIPAANQNLVGLRVTAGLSSRAGVMPLSSTQDVAGPLARTVTDLAVMLDATVGADPADPVSANSAGHIPTSYRDSLRVDALKGARIGVLRSLFGNAPEDEEIGGIVRKAVDAMRAQGAEVVDVTVPDLDALLADSSVIAYEFKFDLADYLAQEPNSPVHSLSDILDRGLQHVQLDAPLRLRNQPPVRDSEAYRQALARRATLRASVIAALAAQNVDALVYPSLRRKPVRIGEAQTRANCQLSASTGLPAIAVSAGFTSDGVPVGMEMLGGAFAEPRLLALDYGWEQVTQPRRAPFSTPPLVDGRAPHPLHGDVRIAQGHGATADVRLRYNLLSGELHVTARAQRAAPSDVIAITLQRGDGERAGPVLAVLTRSGQLNGDTSLTLRGQDREDLLAGKLYVHLYTRASPLGAGRAQVRLMP